jgi:hypothetical protein
MRDIDPTKEELAAIRDLDPTKEELAAIRDATYRIAKVQCCATCRFCNNLLAWNVCDIGKPMDVVPHGWCKSWEGKNDS